MHLTSFVSTNFHVHCTYLFINIVMMIKNSLVTTIRLPSTTYGYPFCRRPQQLQRIRGVSVRLHAHNSVEKHQSVYKTSRSVLGVLLLTTTAIQQDAALGAESTSGYVPSPMEVGWEIYVGAFIGVVPFIVASYEFGKRVVIQRRCEVCRGSGLVSRKGKLVKCKSCGGFLPWLGWKMFFVGTMDPGNGSPVLPPQAQAGNMFYSVAKKEEEKTNVTSTDPSDKEETTS